MSAIITPHDGKPVVAASLAEATAPLQDYEVQVVTSAVVVITVQAQSAREAVERSKRIPGVIWPIGGRLKPQAKAQELQPVEVTPVG